MQLSNTSLTRVEEFVDFNSTVGVIPTEYSEVLDVKIDIAPPEKFDGGLTKIEDKDNLIVGLLGKYEDVFDREIWHFKKGDIVDLDYSKGAGDPELISEVKLRELKAEYPNMNVTQPTETKSHLTIPQGHILVAYIQSSILTKTISYKVTVDHAFYINLPPIYPSQRILPTEIELIKEGYDIDDYDTPPPLVIREILNLSQIVDGDRTTAMRVINSYYNDN